MTPEDLDKLRNEDNLHVLPINDVRPHIESSHCLCQPRKLTDCNVWVHQAYDGRDRRERYDECMKL